MIREVGEIIAILFITANLYALEIYNLNITTTDTVATIQWNTNYITTCKFGFYGKIVNTKRGYAHKVTITEISPCSIYYYVIRLVDGMSNVILYKGHFSTKCVPVNKTKGVLARQDENYNNKDQKHISH